MTDHLEAAIRAADNDGWYDPSVRQILAAALPHLEKHFAQDPNVRRAIIQELAGEAAAEMRNVGLASAERRRAAEALRWLLARLDQKEAENND